jgi:hypothetical protein
MKSLTAVLFSIVALMFTASPARGALVTINYYEFDLGQFMGAAVTTSPTVGTDSLFASTFDNPNGIDLFTIGELATAQYMGDFGDRITLGLDQVLSPPTMIQESLTLTYLNPVPIGPGLPSFFVVFEQASATLMPDVEGTSFLISFKLFGNPTAFDFDALNDNTSVQMGVVGTPPNPPLTADPQNQIVFDLTSLLMLTSTVQLESVTIRNRGIGGVADDPDFLFAGVARAVPEPSSLLVFAIGAVGCGVTARRRRKRADGC